MLSNDTGIHAPPTTGTYAYDTFNLDAASMIAVGATYLDPVFGAVNPEGSTIKRLTNLVGVNFGQDIYSHHWINSNNTLFFWRDGDGTKTVRKMSDGSITTNGSGVPWSTTVSGDVSWHPFLPNIYFYLKLDGIYKYDLNTGTSTLINSPGKFPFNLEQNGGFLDFVDATATKFAVQYNGGGYIYDLTTDTIYTGAVGGPAGGAGVWGMFPNAAHALHLANGYKMAFPLDNVNHVVGTGFHIWFNVGAADAGNHTATISSSNGSNYIVHQENTYGDNYYYAVKVKNQTGVSDAAILADSDNKRLFVKSASMSTHYSGVGLGLFQDWCFLDTEIGTDIFDGGVIGWTNYKQEIISVNVVTLEVRRHAHHRSRNVDDLYDWQPRVSVSWDGRAVMWTSNFNYGGGVGETDAPDGFAIENPLGVADVGFTPPPPPSLLGRNLYVMP